MSSQRFFRDLVTKLQSWLETGAGAIQVLGLLIIAGVLTYILGGVFTGQLFNIEPTEVQRVARSMERFTQFLMVGAIPLAYITILKAHVEQAEAAFGVIVLALLFWFGFSPLCQLMMQRHNGSPNQAMDIAVVNLQLTGQIMCGALLVPVLKWIYNRIRFSRRKKEQADAVAAARLRREPPKYAKPKTKPHVLSPCWHLPYCRDYLVHLCPAFKARRRCWKFGGGCFCDQQMINAMLTGLSQQGGGHRDRAYMEAELGTRRTIMGQRKTKPPCKKCFIYLEHENLKYDVLNPLAYPFTAAAMYFLYEPLVKPVWQQVSYQLTRLWEQISYQPVTTTPEMLARSAGSEAATVMFAVLIGMVLLLGVLQLVENWCFKWKL